MATKTASLKRKRTRTRKPSTERLAVEVDSATQKDMAYICKCYRSVAFSEAVRRMIQDTALEFRHLEQGASIVAQYPNGDKVILRQWIGG